MVHSNTALIVDSLYKISVYTDNWEGLLQKGEYKRSRSLN